MNDQPRSAMRRTQRRRLIGALAASFAATRAGADARDARIVDGSEQSLLALVGLVIEAFRSLGEPLSPGELQPMEERVAAGDLAGGVGAALEALERRVLLIASINPEGQVHLRRGPARAELVQSGYRLFLVRIENPGLVPGKLSVSSPESVPVEGIAPSPPNAAPMGPPPAVPTHAGDIAQRWLSLDLLEEQGVTSTLLPLATDLKIVVAYARDAGRHSARIRATAGSGKNDLGDHDALTVDFQVAPSMSVRLSVHDVDGSPTTCALLVTDEAGRIYPAQTRRGPPDLYFQRQVYRSDGESFTLPSGTYRVRTRRGPEYLVRDSVRRVGSELENRWSLALERWTDPRTRGWFGGDHHIHAAGCAHYMQPTEGVGPEIIARQVQGEGLSIGAILTWAPGFYTQKRNFRGADDPLSSPSMRMRYDLEVSGFPSSHCGHLVLLQMKGMDYPGAARIEDWPSSNAPVLRWAKEQGAITGYAHSGWGLVVPTQDLPNDLMPAFDGIGANDYIATAPAGLVDFISACNTPLAAELNIWYHTLNAGLRTRIGGETDWPCILDEAVGMGRSYVKTSEPLRYEDWCRGLALGRSYVSDGRSHLMDFTAAAAGSRTAVGGPDLLLPAATRVTVETFFTALLEADPTEATQAVRRLGPEDKPYWHIERARRGDTRQVPVELLVNGLAVETRAVEADATIQRLEFSFVPPGSCWIALRVRGSSHTNPIWIRIGDAPVRVRASATWCRHAVDQCWQQKVVRIRSSERLAESAIYDGARAYYDRAITESRA